MSDPPPSEEPDVSAPDSPDSFDALLREAVRVSDATGPATVRLHPGERLCDGRFEVVRLLGAGGMGVVFEAVDHQLGERVALKLLQGRGAGALHATRAEFLTLHDLSHPNLVRLGELLQDGERWLYSMELIDGRNFLDAVRPGGVLDEARLRDALRQLALGLIALHDAGVIHRDLKPSNVLVDGAGRLVLLDFGLAQSTESTARTGGTAAYMPPEQAAGHPVGPAADCFAVGTMLFEALTGALPFEVGSAPEAVRAKRAGLSRRALEGVPHPDLAMLAAALLAPDPDERPDARLLAARLGAEDAVDREHDPPFVGRDEHLNALHRAFADRTQGWVTVHLHGESGIGKSAILSRFAATLRARGALVLEGRCHERVSIPYKTLHDVAHGLAQYLEARGEAAALMSEDLPQLAAVFPILSGMAAGRRAPTIADPQQQRAAAFRGFARMLTVLADATPLALIIDDLQWADEDGIQLLEYLSRHAAHARLLLVIGSRSALDQDRMPLLASSARELSVGPLAPDEATALATALAGDEVSAALAERAHGHPLYLAELARVWARGDVRDEAPQLTEAVARRFAALPAAEAALLGMACIAGEPVPQRFLQHASAGGGTMFHATLAALRAGRWLRTAGPHPDDAVEPYHAVVRGAVTDLLDDETRMTHHEHLARELRDGGLGELRPELLVHHLEGAGHGHEAARWAVRAAVEAEAVLAFDRAAMLYRRALALIGPNDPAISEWRERLGVALANAGRGADAAEAFVDAAESADLRGADLRRRAAEQLLRAGHVDRGLDLMDAVLREQDLPPLRQASWALPRLLLERAKLALRGRRAEPAELTRAKDLRLACCWSACVGAAMTSPVTAAAYQTRHLRLALEAGDPRRIALGLAMEAIGASAAGPPARRAHAILAEADRWAARVNSPETAGYARMARATIAFLCGEWRNALLHADEAGRLFSSECVGCAWEVGTAQRVALTCLWHMGRIRELAARTASALEDAEERGDLYASTQLRTVLQPNILLMQDDLPAARAEIERAAAGLARTAVHLQHWQHMQASALVELYAGSPERAVALIDATLPAVKRAFLFRVLAVRMFTYFVHGSALVGAAARAGGDPALIGRAQRVRRTLLRETGGENAADLLGAQLAELAGRTDRAAELYRRAQHGFLAADTNLLAQTCQLCLARLTRDESAAATARAALASEDIARPDRLCAMLAPVSQ